MTDFINNNKLAIGIIIILVIAIIAYSIKCFVVSTVRDEIALYHKSVMKKNNKIKRLHNQQQQLRAIEQEYKQKQMREQQLNEMDSYMEPVQDVYNNEIFHEEQQQIDNTRLTNDNILMRDINDGFN